MKTSVLLLASLLFVSIINAQEKREDVINDLLESKAESNQDEAIDLTELHDKLLYLYDNPLELNSSTYEDLVSLGILYESQIQKLLTHRLHTGNLLSIYELQGLDGWNLNTIKSLSYFTYVKDDIILGSVGQTNKISMNHLIVKSGRVLESEEGYLLDTTKGYLGNPYNLNIRFNCQISKNIEAGFSIDNDAGEPLFNEFQKYGFDFYSGRLFYSDKAKKLTKVALGDYQFQAGQGLVIWSGLALGKSAEILSEAKIANGLSPYRSVNEYLFLRGGAATYKIKNLSVTAFSSSKKIDANVLLPDTVNNSLERVSTIYTSGYHRTISELSNKNQVRENIGGINFLWARKYLKTGLTMLGGTFSKELITPATPYRIYDFKGRTFFNMGSDYSYMASSSHWFGEVAFAMLRDSLSKKITFKPAQVHGVCISLSDKIDVSMLYRNLSKEYYAFHANTFQEGSQPSNEKGFYLGLVYKPDRNILLRSYVDLFSFPWLNYRVDIPVSGHEYLSQLTYTPSKLISFTLRFREKAKPLNLTETGQMFHQIQTYKRNDFRMQVSYKPSKRVSYTSRVELSKFSFGPNPDQNGFLAYQNVGFTLFKNLNLDLRYAYFDVDGFDARIYMFEDDVPLTFSVPFFNGTGTRSYLLLNTRIIKNLTFYSKISITSYHYQTTTGSGLGLINKPHRTDVRMELKWTF